MKKGNSVSFTYLKGASDGNVGERSKQLVTVELEDGFTKAFYDGRMVGVDVS